MVVTRKDRLCRFGSELVEWIFEKNGTRLVVLGSEVYTNDSEYGELAEDLLAIVTVFVARHNGLRSAANRRRRREAAQEVQEFQEGSEETFSRQGTTYSHLSQPAGAAETQKMDGNSTMDIQSVPYRGREKKDLRALCLNAKNFNDTKLKWVLETPYDIHDEAMILWVLYWAQLQWTANADVSITLLYTYNRSQQEQGTIYLQKRERSKRLLVSATTQPSHS